MGYHNEAGTSSREGSWWTRFKDWWRAHHERLISIADTPHSIALGLAIGIFFGFTPLWSLKTLLSIGVAWLCNSNKIAAAISVTLHDAILPFMPAIYWWEYRIGYQVLHGVAPARMHFGEVSIRAYAHWNIFLRVVWPTLVGSIFLALPGALLVYFLARWTVQRTRARRAQRAADARRRP